MRKAQGGALLEQRFCKPASELSLLRRIRQNRTQPIKILKTSFELSTDLLLVIVGLSRIRNQKHNKVALLDDLLLSLKGAVRLRYIATKH